MKRFLSVLLAVVMCLCSLSFVASADDAAAFAKFDHVVEIHVGMSIDPTDTSLYEGDSAENNVYTRFLLDEFNIKMVVDWTASTTDFAQKVSLCIAADTLPDALVITDYNQFLAALDSDQLYDLTEVYEKYASDKVKGIYNDYGESVFANVSRDGRMYGIQGTEAPVSYYPLMIVQENWLADLGLEVPKTISELHDVAKAIKDAAPAGESTIPILGAAKNGSVYTKFYNAGDSTYSFDPIFTAMNAYPGWFTVDEEGKVQYGTLSQETRDTLEILAKWYAEGLIDPEFATRDNSDDVFAANNAGICFACWWKPGYGSGDSFTNSPIVDYQGYPLYADNGTWNTKQPNLGSILTKSHRLS